MEKVSTALAGASTLIPDARLRPSSLTSARCISPTRPGGVSVDERTQRKLELIRAVRIRDLF